MKRQEFFNAILETRTREYDCLLVDDEHFRLLLQDENYLAQGVGRNVGRVFGLEVIHSRNVEKPLVCAKADVFPVAEDFK